MPWRSSACWRWLGVAWLMRGLTGNPGKAGFWWRIIWHTRRHSLRCASLDSEVRYLVFQRLAHTIGWPPSKWCLFDDVHRKRNLAEYEGFLEVDGAALKELIMLTEQLLSAAVVLTKN